MTVLFGDTNFTGYSVLGSSFADGAYLAAAPFIALSGGQLTSLYAYLQPQGAGSFAMGLYDGQLQRLTYSAPVAVSAPGLVQFPIAPTAIKALQAYQPVLLCLTPGLDFQYGVDSTIFSNAFRVFNANVTPEPPFQLVGPVPTPFQAPVFFGDGDVQAQTITPSGAIGQHVMDTATLIARAFNRTKIRSAVISDEMVEIAKDELFLFLTGDLTNRGIQLFAVDIQLIPMTAGLAGVPMPAGTVDVLNANYRYLSALQSSPAPSFTAVTPTQVTTVGITWAAPAVPILIQMFANGGWQTLQSVSPNASAGQTSLYDLDGSLASTAWQVVANSVRPGSATNVLAASNVTFYNTLSQTPMQPYSRDDFANLSNTFFGGRPFQYWLDRQDPWPIMRLWPTPQLNDQQNACIVLWRKRQIMDVGLLSERVNVPNRWLTAVIDGLAFRLGKAIREVDPNLLPILKVEATESLNAVRAEERENAPLRIVPQIYGYTR